MIRCCSSKTSRQAAGRSSTTPTAARRIRSSRTIIRADAVLLNLHIIGEAVKKLPDDLRERHPNVAWREIAGLRDVIAHTYFALDTDILWDAVERDVPALLDAVRKIIRTERRNED